jgi:hypothetical protein
MFEQELMGGMDALRQAIKNGFRTVAAKTISFLSGKINLYSIMLLPVSMNLL